MINEYIYGETHIGLTIYRGDFNITVEVVDTDTDETCERAQATITRREYSLDDVQGLIDFLEDVIGVAERDKTNEEVIREQLNRIESKLDYQHPWKHYDNPQYEVLYKA